jgi:ubiquitin carboxyl-terminal hydrolase 6/32
MPQEAYFLSTEKYRPVLFGLPIVVSCSGSTTYQDLYKSVWVQVSRLVSPLPPKDQTQNHATDWYVLFQLHLSEGKESGDPKCVPKMS